MAIFTIFYVNFYSEFIDSSFIFFNNPFNDYDWFFDEDKNELMYFIDRLSKLKPFRLNYFII